MHISNFIHLVLVFGLWLVLSTYLRRTSATRFRAALRLLQILPVMFALDITVGYLIIDSIYGPNQSASWIAKTVWIYPGLFILSLWQLLRARRNKTKSENM
ncbi:MAG: hypothetical protein ACFHXK_00950 [bacterium]